MIDLKRRNLTMEDALEAFKSESKPILSEYSEHKYYSPDRKRHHRKSMKSAAKKTKGGSQKRR